MGRMGTAADVAAPASSWARPLGFRDRGRSVGARRRRAPGIPGGRRGGARASKDKQKEPHDRHLRRPRRHRHRRGPRARPRARPRVRPPGRPGRRERLRRRARRRRAVHRARPMQVVEEIRALGGEAVANADDVADWAGAQNAGPHRDRQLRPPRRAREQRRIPARPDARQHVRAGVGRGRPGAPEGPLRPAASCGSSTGASGRRPATPADARVINTSSGAGLHGQRRPGQLLRGEGRHRRDDARRGGRDRPLRRDRQRASPPPRVPA